MDKPWTQFNSCSYLIMILLEIRLGNGLDKSFLIPAKNGFRKQLGIEENDVSWQISI